MTLTVPTPAAGNLPKATQIVQIPDQSLEQVVRQTLGKAVRPLTLADMARLTSLDLGNPLDRSSAPVRRSSRP